MKIREEESNGKSNRVPVIKKIILNILANPKESLLFVFLLVSHILFLWIYRPYAYAHYAETIGFNIVNNYPSILAVPLGYLLVKICSVKIKINSLRIKLILLGSIMLGNYLYEGLDIYLGSGDWFDMLGITLGGIIVIPFIFLSSSLRNAKHE